MSVQAQVLNLMQDLQDQFGLAFLFISHDLAVVDMVCDEVIVLYQGRIVERGAPDTLFQRAAHPYTRALLQAVPRLQPGAAARAARRCPGACAVGAAPAAGCAFAPRCAWATERCRGEQAAAARAGRWARPACTRRPATWPRPWPRCPAARPEQ